MVNNPDAGLKKGTLMDLYKLSQDAEKCQAVNLLDAPMGQFSVAVPPQYRYVQSLIPLVLVVKKWIDSDMWQLMNMGCKPQQG